MKRYILLTVALVFLAQSAFAAATTELWSKNPAGDGTVSNDTSRVTSISIFPGQTWYWNPTTAGESPVINAQACDQVDITFNSDTTTAVHSSILQALTCNTATYNASTCTVFSTTSLTGNPSGGLHTYQGFGGTFIVLDLTTLGASDVPHAQLKCNS